MSLYGDIKAGPHVETAVKEHIEDWMSVYLAEIERQNDIDVGTLERIRSFHTAPEFDRWPEDQIPGILVVSPGIVPDSAKSHGGGKVRVKWVVGVGVIVSANTQENTNDLAKLYGAAIRALIMQHPSLGGFARGVDWRDESFDEISTNDVRTQATALEIFNIEVDEVVDRSGGLRTPPADPLADPGDWPTATETNLEVEKVN